MVFIQSKWSCGEISLLLTIFYLNFGNRLLSFIYLFTYYRGDHTSVDFFMAVIPPQTECVVFSIDGSFTASMSVTGRDPKVRAGAVDVARYDQKFYRFRGCR